MIYYTRKEMIKLLGIKEVEKLDKYADESKLPKTLVYNVVMSVINRTVKNYEN